MQLRLVGVIDDADICSELSELAYEILIAALDEMYILNFGLSACATGRQ